jgi:broad specificity phosphatase PhoE
MSEIYFIRHGQASFGEENYDRLSPVGIRQSGVTADHLFNHGIDFHAVYCGRLQRHKDTARTFCSLYGAQQPELKEPTVLRAFDEYDARALIVARTQLSRDPGALSVKALRLLRTDKRTFQAYFSDTVNRWMAGEFDAATDVETWSDFHDRVAHGLKQIIEHNRRSKRLAVFTSGGPISAVVKMALGLSSQTTVELSWQIMNASLTCVKYTGDSLILSMFNNTTHLILENDPALMTYR